MAKGLPVDPKKFSRLRESTRMTQEEFGQKIGMSGGNVQRIESAKGVTSILLRNFRRMAEVLGRDPDELEDQIAPEDDPSHPDHEAHAAALRAFADLSMADQELVVARLEQAPILTILSRMTEQVQRLGQHTAQQQKAIKEVLAMLEKEKSPKPGQKPAAGMSFKGKKTA